MQVRYFASFGVGLAVCLMLAPAAPGHFIVVELQQVPVERLVTNLEAAVTKDPKNAQALVNLARVHGMAYALKTDAARVWKGHEEEGPWFGYVPKLVPFSTVVATKDAAKQKASKAHLAKAVARFREALKLAPENLAARLGYAWTLEQSGAKKEAIEEYRALIEDAWKTEKALTSRPMNGETVVTEAVDYLLPLLDREKDKEEIEKLADRALWLHVLPQPITPVAVPLRDALRARDIEDKNSAVTFDADGSGLKRKWTWITKDAGWLVYDSKGRGDITSGLQWFGNVTFWLFWETGYDALASLDDNRDGALTGGELLGLAIWNDAQGDGVCDPGEVKPLSEYGIVAVSCRHERDPVHPDRIAFSPMGVTYRDGKTRSTFDLILNPTARPRSSRSRKRHGLNETPR